MHHWTLFIEHIHISTNTIRLQKHIKISLLYLFKSTVAMKNVKCSQHDVQVLILTSSLPKWEFNGAKIIKIWFLDHSTQWIKWKHQPEFFEKLNFFKIDANMYSQERECRDKGLPKLPKFGRFLWFIPMCVTVVNTVYQIIVHKHIIKYCIVIGAVPIERAEN